MQEFFEQSALALVNSYVEDPRIEAQGGSQPVLSNQLYYFFRFFQHLPA